MSSYNKINGTYTSESNDLLTKILRNDWNFQGYVMTDWGGGSDLTAVFASVGAFALNSSTSLDAVLVVTLAPGTYTAQVSGVNNTGGLALVEVYEVP